MRTLNGRRAGLKEQSPHKRSKTGGGGKQNPVLLIAYPSSERSRVRRLVLDPIYLYRNRPDDRFYDVAAREMRGGPDKVIVYVDGVLCAMDRETRITIPISRWKLAEIGLACFWVALRGKAATADSVEPVQPLVLPEIAPEIMDRENHESQWERLMNEMGDLSR
jgi:hypothetical protein